MYFGYDNPEQEYYMDTHRLVAVDSEKDLGIIVDKEF